MGEEQHGTQGSRSDRQESCRNGWQRDSVKHCRPSYRPETRGWTSTKDPSD